MSFKIYESRGLSVMRRVETTNDRKLRIAKELECEVIVDKAITRMCYAHEEIVECVISEVNFATSEEQIETLDYLIQMLIATKDNFKARETISRYNEF